MCFVNENLTVQASIFQKIVSYFLKNTLKVSYSTPSSTKIFKLTTAPFLFILVSALCL